MDKASYESEIVAEKAYVKKDRKWEKIIEIVFLLCACIAIVSVAVIAIFIFVKGMPAMFQIGLFDFIFGMEWFPTHSIEPKYGIFPMIIASFMGTTGAIIIGVPIGIFSAVLLAEIAPDWVAKIFRPCIELLAGIPSVVYGFFGLVVIVPIIDKKFGGGGNSLLAMIIILVFMILPTIVNISETSLRAVPKEFKEGSLALGASHIETIFKIMIPASKSGILAAVVLGIGRAIGETMAVILVCGNTVQIPAGTDWLFDRVRPLTANIALEMAYAGPFHEKVLFSTGVILFIFILGLNVLLNYLVHKNIKE